MLVYKITESVSYSVHPSHRNRAIGKSQWTVSETTEKNVFARMLDNEWIQGNVGWGVHVNRERLQYVGVSADGQRKLVLAKFVDGNANNEWHGYPADHQRSNSDIPASEILKKWLSENIMSAAKIRKISKGQPCSL
jgi:hypothetical protein